MKHQLLNLTKTKNVTPPTNRSGIVNRQRGQQGFTIIEVALVLAIAGLIFLVVFLSITSLQNSQKDNARKQDVARVISALQAYEADNGGDLSSLGNADGKWYSASSASSSGFSGYLGKLSQATWVTIWTSDNPTALYGGFLAPGGNGNVNGDTPSIGVIIGHTCAQLKRTWSDTSDTSQSDAAVWSVLSDGKTVYCVDM